MTPQPTGITPGYEALSDTDVGDEERVREPMRPRRPLWQRVLLVLGGIVAGLALPLVVLYNFGGMGRSEFDPEIRRQYQKMVESDLITPVERQFVVPIPGCTCHSSDPRLTEEHRFHRMNECGEAGCHG